MEQVIGVLLLGGSLYVVAMLFQDAREQGWRWYSRVLLLAAGGAMVVLSLLIVLGSTQAAKIVFVGFGMLLVGVMALVGLLVGVLWVAARRKKSELD